MLRSIRAKAVAALLTFALVQPLFAQEAEEHDAAAVEDELREGFENPPPSARPRVWWHWMNGNISKDGIEKDFAWFRDIGIGGVQNFDAGLGTPQIVDKRLIYMEPDWQSAFRHAVAIADQSGLEFAIAASPGWSQTGGPWVPPEDAMKKIVWGEMILRGVERYSGALPPYPTNAGHYQNVALRDRVGRAIPADQQPELASGRIAVLGIPITHPAIGSPIATDSDAMPIDVSALEDDDLESHITIRAGDISNPGFIALQYPTPVTVRSASIFVHSAKKKWRKAMYVPELLAETANGWEKVADFALTEVPATAGFEPVTASRFRMVFNPVPDANAMNLGDGVPGADDTNRRPAPFPDHITIGDLRLSAEPRIDRFEIKANFAVGDEFFPIWDHSRKPGHDIADIVDLTNRVSEDGKLDWTPPDGRDWRIVNLGWSITGERNHPASPEATGLEVDKFDASAVRRYMETYLGLYRKAVGPDLFGKRGLNAILTDSIEVGGANWTEDMLEAFSSRRGYDLRPWLPALMGHVIISPDASERFLYDWRLTLSELMTEAHYATVAEAAHENGLTVYGEALEGARPALGDDLAMRSYTDVPMAAMWMFNPDEAPRSPLVGDIKGAASVAQIYGQNIVAAESLTAILAPWAYAPAQLKRVMDYEFVLGVNRPVIHTSVHQPSDDHVPGLSLGSVGQYFNRHETWAGMAKPWVDYMARSSFLLQQGHGHGDIAYFYGEETPIVQQFAETIPTDLPVQFAYDFVNADILSNRISVKGGELVVMAPGAGSYKALYLGGTSQMMTLATLQRIAELVEAGATVIGEKPVDTPNLLDDPVLFSALADRLWSESRTTHVAKGLVIRGTDPEAVLLASGLAADFSYTRSRPDSEILFRHRKLEDGDIYFLSNRRQRSEKTHARFRVTGKQPELWDAVSGSVTPLSFSIEGDQTIVPLEFAADEAFFVVFREDTALNQREVPRRQFRPLFALDGPWDIALQPGRSAPERIALDRLLPLNEHAKAGMKYFSGVSTYTTNFTLGAEADSDRPLWLDLGKVGDLAEVYVNEVPAGISWFAPHRMEISGLARQGENTLTIKVANRWINRLIGDKQTGEDPVAFVASSTYFPDAPLRPSGLIGPVQILEQSPADLRTGQMGSSRQ